MNSSPPCIPIRLSFNEYYLVNLLIKLENVTNLYYKCLKVVSDWITLFFFYNTSILTKKILKIVWWKFMQVFFWVFCVNFPTKFKVFLHEQFVNINWTLISEALDLYHVGSAHAKQIQASLDKKVMRQFNFSLTVENLKQVGVVDVCNIIFYTTQMSFLSKKTRFFLTK